MAKPRPEKNCQETTPAQPTEQRVLPMQLQVGDRLVDRTHGVIVARLATSHSPV